VNLPVQPLHLLAANIGQNKSIPANGHIELAFDRLLQPVSISRQTFVLEDIGMTVALTPSVTYDPVARIVTITPMTGTGQTLTSGQTYQLTIAAPQNASDVNGLRAIDGALLEAPSTRTLAFTVTDAVPQPAPIAIDFCRDINPILQGGLTGGCLIPTCHASAQTAVGLALDTPADIAKTAIGRVSIEANTGARSVAQPPSLLFGEDMPIIDGKGDSANSWLMYKVLLAQPTPEADAGVEAPSEAGAAAADDGGTGTDGEADGGSAEAGEIDAGAADSGKPDAGTTKPVTIPPIDVSNAHLLPFTADSDADRAVLSQYVLGSEMPFPGSGFFKPLTISQLERVNLWIAQGTPMPSGTCSH
jgi:hypothetical protein